MFWGKVGIGVCVPGKRRDGCFAENIRVQGTYECVFWRECSNPEILGMNILGKT